MKGIRLAKGTFGIFPAKYCKGLHPIQQIILTWLWFHKNNEGFCFPSLKTLSEECGITKKTLIKHLVELEEKKFIRRRRRLNEKHEFTSTLYEIYLGGGGDIQGCSEVEKQGGGESKQPPSVEATQGSGGGKQKLKPSNQNQFSNQTQTTENLFEDFWKKYPEKNNQSKKETGRKYLKLLEKNPALHEEIMAALENQIDIRAIHKFGNVFEPNWKYATTWLNQECWKSEIKIKKSQLLPNFVKEKIQRYRANLNQASPDELVRTWKREALSKEFSPEILNKYFFTSSN